MAVGCAAVSSIHELQAEAITHRRPKGPRVHVEVKRRRRESVQPIARVRESERVEASLVAYGVGGEEQGAFVRKDFGGERVLGGRWGKKLQGGVSGVA